MRTATTAASAMPMSTELSVGPRWFAYFRVCQDLWVYQACCASISPSKPLPNLEGPMLVSTPDWPWESGPNFLLCNDTRRFPPTWTVISVRGA